MQMVRNCLILLWVNTYNRIHSDHLLGHQCAVHSMGCFVSYIGRLLTRKLALSSLHHTDHKKDWRRQAVSIYSNKASAVVAMCKLQLSRSGNNYLFAMQHNKKFYLVCHTKIVHAPCKNFSKCWFQKSLV